MLWFKHRSDARNSLKLRKVRRKYGSDGYAIYWFCLEAIAYDVDKDNLTFDLKEDSETIGFELDIQEHRVDEIMRYMVSVGLFESSMGLITCMKLAESIDQSMTNSPKMRKWLGANNKKLGKLDGYVYFILAENGDHKKIKIGRSANPHSRISQLRVREDCRGWDLSIIATIKTDDSLSLECSLHEKYKNQALGREFFSITPELINEINSYKLDNVELQLELEVDKIRSRKEIDITPLVQPEVKPSKYKFNDYQMDFAKWMHSLILKISPSLKQPSFESWANTIRLMIDNDNRNGDHMVEVFTWCNKDSFWSSNILSPTKFRKQFDQLVAKMNTTSKSNAPYERTQAEVDQFTAELNDQFERSQAAKARREARELR